MERKAGKSHFIMAVHSEGRSRGDKEVFDRYLSLEEQLNSWIKSPTMWLQDGRADMCDNCAAGAWAMADLTGSPQPPPTEMGEAIPELSSWQKVLAEKAYTTVINSVGLGVKYLVQILALLLTSWVTKGKLFNCHVPQLPHLENRDSSYLPHRVVVILNELTCVEHLGYIFAYSKCLISVSYYYYHLVIKR